MYHIFLYPFIHSGHLGCFHTLAVANSALVKTGVHASFQIWVFILSEYMLKSGIAPSYGNYIFRLLRKFILYSIVAVPIYVPTNSVGLFPFLHTLLIVFLIFIFLMISDVSFFIWLLVIWLLYFCKAFCVHFRISAQTYWCVQSTLIKISSISWVLYLSLKFWLLLTLWFSLFCSRLILYVTLILRPSMLRTSETKGFRLISCFS